MLRQFVTHWEWNRRTRAAWVISLILLSSSVVGAATLTFSGTLPQTNPNLLVEILFTANTDELTVYTNGWANGGFDPMLWVFDATGTTQLDGNDDIAPMLNLDASVPSQTNEFRFVRGKQYLLVVTAFDQHFCDATKPADPDSPCFRFPYSGWTNSGDFDGRLPLWGVVFSSASSAGPGFVTINSGPSTIGNYPQRILLSSVANAASYAGGAVSPGEIVILFGSGLGPAQLAGFTLDASGLAPTQLAGTTVSMNGTAARIVYTSSTQVAAIVPYSISGSSEQITVAYQGHTSDPLVAAVAPSGPGLFTADASGQGQAAAVNQDGSINSVLHPARAGHFISLFATGGGQTDPPGIDGKPAANPLPRPLLPVRVTVGGEAAQVQYSGGAPGELAGMMQVNVLIPSGVSGNVPVVVQVGDAPSQPNVTIAVE